VCSANGVRSKDESFSFFVVCFWVLERVGKRGVLAGFGGAGALVLYLN
jgi:hypothetical protein